MKLEVGGVRNNEERENDTQADSWYEASLYNRPFPFDRPSGRR